MNTVRVLLIGIGFHARRIYVPAIIRQSAIRPVSIVAGVDVSPAKKTVDAYLKAKGLDIEMVYLEPFELEVIPDDNARKLDELVARHSINAVVISTEPIVHKAYAKWALSHGLHILMDKPISARKQVNSSIAEAKGLFDDYVELNDAYVELQKTSDTIFSVNVQRRYEIGYQKVFDLIKEVADRFNAPVTSIQAMHSDGVWIFPDEIVEQVTHPYSGGYGKCSHSGYHIFDIVWQFYQAGMITDKHADSVEVMTSFLNPRGLLKQFGQKDFAAYFPDYNETAHRTEDDLWDLFEKYGEIDAFSLIRLLKNGETICNISSNLIHNGFSRRSWAMPHQDLYKGNGRVKHQSFSIQQGPFQNIQIHQYQSEDEHEENSVKDYILGGNNHFEIFVFRNAKMFEANEPSLATYNLQDLDIKQELDNSRLYNETAKDSVLTEFFEYILGRIPKESLKSNIDTHATAAHIMSAIYQSQAQQVNGETPLAGFRL